MTPATTALRPKTDAFWFAEADLSGRTVATMRRADDISASARELVVYADEFYGPARTQSIEPVVSWSHTGTTGLRATNRPNLNEVNSVVMRGTQIYRGLLLDR